MSLWRRAAVVLMAALLAVGCSFTRNPGEQKEPGREDELREVAELLTLASGQGRGYDKPADLARYAEGFPLGYRAVVSGAIVIVPGATMPGEGERGGSEAVVAYEKDVPVQGGLVLLHNRTIKKMSPAEWQAAPRAGK
jgi:hypothetical protein